jgi:hypothetical protein
VRLKVVRLPLGGYPCAYAVRCKPFMSLSFLVLSDIHFGRYAASGEFAPHGTAINEIANAVSIRESLIATATHFRPNAILAPGDLTSIATPAEFTGAVALINQIADGCSISREDIFCTFGNHDANWRISKLGAADEKFPADAGYGRVATEIGGMYASNTGHRLHGPLPGTGLFQRTEYDLLVLNSGYFCAHDQAFPHGKLGADQLNWVKQILNKWEASERWKIVMLHHHPFNYPYPTLGPDVSTLEEGPDLLEAIGKAGVDLVCHGHRHHPKLCTRTENGWDHPVTFLCAGSVGVTEQQRNNGDIPNLFHVVSFLGRDNLGSAIGQIDTFRYTAGDGWIRSRRSAAVPLDSPQIFGSCATADQCKKDANNCVVIAAKSLPAQLPKFQDLPITLQCMPWSDLKKLIIDAAKSLGCNVFGDYPADVIIVPKVK